MKKITISGLTLIFFSILLSGCASTQAIAQNEEPSPVTYQTFYDDLSPYGTWVDYPPYGNVWDPNVAAGFRPYFTNGYWNYTSEGNLWLSGYSWGWMPFHYGRWIYDDVYGWLWVPGYEWSPAWVTWGMMDGFYAWAPLLPGVNVGMNFGSWRPALFYWNVVNQKHLYDRNIMNVAEKRDNINGYADRINIINNFGTTRTHNQYYSKGPDSREYEKTTNMPVRSFNIRESNKPGENRQNGNDVQIYRPMIVHSQPRESRRLDRITVNPVKTNNDRTSTPHEQQMENINRLPVHSAPAGSYENRNADRGNDGQRRR